MRSQTCRVRQVSLTYAERVHTGHLLKRVFAGRARICLDEFLLEAHVRAQELPERIRAELYAFKLRGHCPVISIKTNPLAEEGLEPTPSSLPVPTGFPHQIRWEEALHLLYASLLGEPFGWTSIQQGRLINEVYPIRANESELVSSGSRYDLGLHTEDAFSPWAGEYLGLMCLRNPHNVPTLMSWIRDVTLTREVVDILFQPRFRILPNRAHWVSPSIAKSSILFGAHQTPYLRINLNVQDSLLDDDVDAKLALSVLKDELESHAFDLVMEEGECCYIDNWTIAHGRKAFLPRYDGTDRWLKRLYVTTDLRRTRHLRQSDEARIIAPENAIEYCSSAY